MARVCFASPNTKRRWRVYVWMVQSPAQLLAAVVPNSAVGAAVWDLGTWALSGVFTAFLDDLYFVQQ